MKEENEWENENEDEDENEDENEDEEEDEEEESIFDTDYFAATGDIGSFTISSVAVITSLATFEAYFLHFGAVLASLLICGLEKRFGIDKKDITFSDTELRTSVGNLLGVNMKLTALKTDVDRLKTDYSTLHTKTGFGVEIT